MIKNLFV